MPAQYAGGAKYRRALLVSGFVLGLGAGQIFGQAAAAPARVIPLRNAPLLFVDDSGIAQRAHLTRTVHPGRRRSEPVLVADRPWEHLRVYLWGTVHFDPKTRKFSMWYMSRLPPPNTGTQNLYATSDDGLRWTKPALGLFEFNGSKENNIIDNGGGSLAVLVDPFERDAAKRYKRFTHRRGGYFAAHSADGIHWTQTSETPVLDAGDTITLAQHPETGEYLAFHKRPYSRGGFDVRAVWLARSRDFQSWTKPQLVFAADDADQEWASAPDERMEVYDMSVFPHAAGFVGLPAMFRNKPQEITPELRAAGAVAADGPLDIQLATSSDGATWRRSWPRIAVIPRGAPGTFDGGAILNTACAPVHTDTETWVYYSAINTSHGAPVPPKQITIARAEWRRHGFVSLDAGPQGGGLETQPLRCGGAQLLVNADASGGELRVMLREADGTPIAGYGFEECSPLTRDATRWPVRWGDRTGVPVDRPVRIAIQMKSVQLFSVESGQ